MRVDVPERAAGAALRRRRASTGPEFRRVDLTGTPRAGVLTQASVLTVSSYATRTSPVLRGKWILENLLNAPPPAAAARRRRPRRGNGDGTDVAAPAVGGAPRERHLRGVPPPHGSAGLRPRELRRDRRLARPGRGVRRSMRRARCPTGAASTTRTSLQTHPRGRARGVHARRLTAKLLTYALGRGLEPSDRRTVRTIARDLPAQTSTGSRALVLAIVRSPPFQMRARTRPP